MFTVGRSGCLVLGLSATFQRNDGLTHVLHWFLGGSAFSASRDPAAAQSVRVRLVEVGGQVLRGTAVEVVSALGEDEHRSSKVVQQVVTWVA